MQEQQRYDRLVNLTKRQLEEQTRESGLACTIDGRAKEVSSLLKKILKKDAEAPGKASVDQLYDRVRDKAGARVSVFYRDQIPAVEAILERTFNVVEIDNKADSLKAHELGYLAVHYQVEADRALAGDDNVDLVGLECEVQVRSYAQSLWADVSHKLSYKPSQTSSDGVQRMIFRLAAMLELFDEEALRARDKQLAEPGFEEAALLNELERHYYRFTGRPFDREFSLLILDYLRPLWEGNGTTRTAALLEAFVQSEGPKLAEIYEQYRHDARHLLITQPESLLIFAELQRDKFALESLWEDNLPLNLLEPLAAAWGTSIGA